MALLNDNSLCWQTAETVLWESLRDGKLDWSCISWGDATL